MHTLCQSRKLASGGFDVEGLARTNDGDLALGHVAECLQYRLADVANLDALVPGGELGYEAIVE